MGEFRQNFESFLEVLGQAEGRAGPALFAKRIKISPGYVSKLRSGDAQPESKFWAGTEKEFGHETVEFLGGNIAKVPTFYPRHSSGNYGEAREDALESALRSVTKGLPIALLEEKLLDAVRARQAPAAKILVDVLIERMIDAPPVSSAAGGERSKLVVSAEAAEAKRHAPK